MFIFCILVFFKHDLIFLYIDLKEGYFLQIRFLNTNKQIDHFNVIEKRMNQKKKDDCFEFIFLRPPVSFASYILH